MSSSLSFEALINQSLDRELDGEIALSLQNAKAALAQAQAASDADACAEALARLGNVHYRLGHFDKMGALARQALSQAGEETRARADALILMGIYAFETGSLGDAESNFLYAADLCRQIDYPFSRFRALHNMAACIYSMRGQFYLALAADEEAYRIACQINSPQKLAPLIAMCFVHLEIGQLAQAHQKLETIASLIIPDSLYYGYYLMLQSRLAQYEGDISLALSTNDQAQNISEKIGEISLHVFLSMGKSYCHRMLGNPSRAVEWSNDAVEWANRANNRRMTGRALTERGRAAWLVGDLNMAEKDLHNAIADLSERHQYFDLSLAQFYLAALLLACQNPGAEIIWQQAVNHIIIKDYGSILDRNRDLAYPLIAAFSNPNNPELAELSTRCITFLQQIPPPPLHGHLLGGYQIIQGGRIIDERLLRKRRAGELFALLLLDRSHSLTFDQIADLLWQDKDTDSAQMLFHQATSSLRRLLEPKLPEKFASRYLTVLEGSVTLKLPEGTTLDFIEFEKRCKEEDWEAALMLYAGDLLPGYLYAGWAAAPRERVKQLYLRALLVSAHRQLEAKHPREVIDLCHCILEIDPWQEDAVFLAMRSYIALNDRAGAIRIYRALEKTLSDDLQTKPQANLQEIYQSLI